jgi:hypothetical protein
MASQTAPGFWKRDSGAVGCYWVKVARPSKPSGMPGVELRTRGSNITPSYHLEPRRSGRGSASWVVVPIRWR